MDSKEENAMESSTISSISTITSSLGTLQRINPTSNSDREKQRNPKQKDSKKQPELVPDLTYSPDGHITDEDHGLRIDISA